MTRTQSRQLPELLRKLVCAIDCWEYDRDGANGRAGRSCSGISDSAPPGRPIPITYVQAVVERLHVERDGKVEGNLDDISGVISGQEPTEQAVVAAAAGENGNPQPGTPLRLVKSARPVSPNEPVLDASVWSKQALKRPPSRQKRPPEALHLFEGAGMWKGAAGMKGRPQTAMGLACSHRAPLSAPAPAPLGVRRSGGAGCRPISRHRPPPESLDLTQQTRF